MKPIGPIPKRVKCVSQGGLPSHFNMGYEYEVTGDGYIKFGSGSQSSIVWNSQSSNSKFQPIYTDEELLEYAKKMYPEGTEFYNNKGEYRKSEGINYLINPNDGNIDVQAFAKDGTRLAPDIYSPVTGWAEIIELPKSSIESPSIDLSSIGIGNYVKIIDRPANGKPPSGWVTDMEFLYGTWQEVVRLGPFGNIEVPAPTREKKDTWSINLSGITAVKSYNPDVYISGCDTAVKGGDATVIGTVDIATMRIEVEYDPIMDYKPTLSRPPESRMVLGLDILPVPSLRVSRKNIVK